MTARFLETCRNSYTPTVVAVHSTIKARRISMRPEFHYQGQVFGRKHTDRETPGLYIALLGRKSSEYIVLSGDGSSN